MSFTYVVMYFIGLAIFGVLYWILNGITDILKAANIADITTFTPYDLLMYVWGGIVVVYLIFGGVWMVRSFQKGINTPYQ